MRRLLIGLLSTIGALLTALVVGGGLVYAGQLLPAPGRDRTLDITATLTGDDDVILPPERRACLERFGLLLSDGFIQYGGPVEGTCDGTGTVRRSLIRVVQGEPVRDVEQPARFDEYIYGGDPDEVEIAVGEVQVPTELGDAPAWLSVGGGDRWAIVVHGRSGTRGEALRILPTLVGQDLRTLVITHRNDMAGGPAAEDDTGRYGQREWRDVQAAVAFAQARGARDIVLVGMSQGASLIGYYLREVGPEGIVGVIIDSPLLSLHDTLVQQARRRSIPGPLIPPILFGTKHLTRLQSGFDVDDVHHVDTFAASRIPLLVFHGGGDDFVPIEPTDELAMRRSEALTYARFEEAGHVEAFNSDPERYIAAVRVFLDSL